MTIGDPCDPRSYPQVSVGMFDHLTPQVLGQLYCTAQQRGSDLFAQFAEALIVAKELHIRYHVPEGALDLVARVCAADLASAIARFRGKCRFSHFAEWTARKVCSSGSPYVQQRMLAFDPALHERARSVTLQPQSGPATFDRAWLEATYPKLQHIFAEIARRKQRPTSEEAQGHVSTVNVDVKLMLFIAHKLNGETYEALEQQFCLPVPFIQKLINNVSVVLCESIRRAYLRRYPQDPDVSDQRLFRWLLTQDDDDPPTAGVPSTGGRSR